MIRLLVRKFIMWFAPLRGLMIWYIAVLHTTWGVLLFFSVQPLKTTPIFTMTRIVADQHILAFILVMASILSMIELFARKPRWYGFAYFLPQFAALVISAVGGVIAVLTGQYADGVPRPWDFIYPDQSYAIWAAVFYFIAIVTWRSDLPLVKP